MCETWSFDINSPWAMLTCWSATNLNLNEEQCCVPNQELILVSIFSGFITRLSKMGLGIIEKMLCSQLRFVIEVVGILTGANSRV